MLENVIDILNQVNEISIVLRKEMVFTCFYQLNIRHLMVRWPFVEGASRFRTVSAPYVSAPLHPAPCVTELGVFAPNFLDLLLSCFLYFFLSFFSFFLSFFLSLFISFILSPLSLSLSLSFFLSFFLSFVQKSHSAKTKSENAAKPA